MCIKAVRREGLLQTARRSKDRAHLTFNDRFVLLTLIHCVDNRTIKIEALRHLGPLELNPRMS